MLSLALILTACGWQSSPSVLDVPPPEARRPRPRPSTAVVLFEQAPTEIQVPDRTRPDPALEEIRLSGPVVRDRATPRGIVWKVPMPILPARLANRSTNQSVAALAPPDMQIIGPAGPLPFTRRGFAAGSWGLDESFIYLGTSQDEPPDPPAFRLRYPRAATAERRLNFTDSGREVQDFIRYTAHLGETSHRGLYLPAPSTAVFDVTVPDQGVFSFSTLRLPSSFVHDDLGDGAQVEIAVRTPASSQVLATVDATSATPNPTRLDLASYSGQSVQLVLRTLSKEDARFDYVLLEEPVLYTPRANPERIVLLFVDTLRPDHLGFMGYSRPTTPTLDRWAAHAAVFEQARAVAPWTLPSAMAALSGAQPELWSAIPNLPERLGAAGWRTEAIVTNAFLSAPFNMHRGWDRYTYIHLLTAEDLVKRAQSAIAATPDRDLLVLVHFMEPHLPYNEPSALKNLFAGPMPQGLKEPLIRVRLEDWTPQHEGFEKVRDYLIARYDQNIRAVDDAIEPLLNAAGPQATTVLFSDHGEAFWEHGQFEHGHDFHDELLRVALAIRSPHLPAGRHPAPTSLLDITPTLMEIAGLPSPTRASGRSLVPLAWADAEAGPAFTNRPQAFGRPLYGPSGWGVIDGTQKWWARNGAQTLYDLAQDTAEATDIAATKDLGRFPDRLQAALGQPVKRAWRFSLRSLHPSDIRFVISHPGGIDEAWLDLDPRGRPSALAPNVVEGRVEMTLPKLEQTLILYVIPHEDPLRPQGLALTAVGRDLAILDRIEAPTNLNESSHSEVFFRVGDPRFSAKVDLSWVPIPVGNQVVGYHPDVQQSLRELGYLE